MDAGAVDAAVSDGGPPPLTNAWGPPVRVAELSSDDYYEYKPSIRGDGLEAFFYRPGIGAMSIFYSSRTSTANPWSTPVPTIGNHGTPELSANGLELYYVSSGPTIYRRVRASTSSSFDVAVGLYSGEAPTITGDGRYLYYKNNSGEFVMRSRFSASGTFGAEQLVLLPGAPDYANLSMSRDHLVVVLAGNNQVGDPTQVEFVRETVQSPWQGPFEILELTSRGGGNCHLVSGWDMYCAMINDANGTADIYRLQRTGP